MKKNANDKEHDLKDTIAAAKAEVAAEIKEGEKKQEDEKKHPCETDVDMLNAIAQKYPLNVDEKKLITKITSLLETYKTRCMLPKQNVGDSVFKMYNSDEEPTEFVVDRIEFDDSGWRLISYERFGLHELEFIFCEKDYNKLFFDTADQAKKYHGKSKV